MLNLGTAVYFMNSNSRIVPANPSGLYNMDLEQTA